MKKLKLMLVIGAVVPLYAVHPPQNRRVRPARVLLAGCLAVVGACEQGIEPVRAGSEAVEFDLELSIPREIGAEEPLFHRITGVEFAPDGEEIYVLDNFRASVRVFDRDGALVREFGHVEAGPVGLTQPMGLQVLSDVLYLRNAGDSRHILRFTPEGGALPPLLLPLAGYLAPDGEPVSASPSRALRFDQVLFISVQDLVRDYVVARQDGQNGETVARFHSGAAGAISTTTGHRVPLRGTPIFGSEGIVSVGGDSLIVTANSHRGIVRWHQVELGSVTPVVERDLDWDPVPIGVTERQARARHAERAGVAESEFEVLLPEFKSDLISVTVAREGDAWLHRRGTRPLPERFHEEMIVVPMDPARPVRELQLPENFLLQSVAGERLLGIHRDPETDQQTVRVYRWMDGAG